jgi:MFS family permease
MFSKVPRNVFVLGLVSFFNDTASEMIYPIVPIFLTSVLGAPVSIVGLIEGIAEGLASLLKFIFGYWSDRIGKRMVFVTSGYSFGAISKILIGLASSWPLVLFARIIDRLGKGLRTSPRDALLLQNASSTNRGFIFGFHRAMDSAGAVLGPLLALALLDLFKENIRTIFFIAFIPGLIGVLLLVILVREKRQTSFPTTADKQLTHVLNSSSKLPHAWSSLVMTVKNINQSLILFFLISVIFSLGNSSDAFLILQAKHLGLTTTLVVLAYVLYNVSQTIFATPAGQLADKIGARRVYAAGLVVFGLVYLAFGATKNSQFFWILFPIYGIYIAFTDGVSKSYISEFITEKVSGTYFGLYQTGISVAAFLASLVGGLLWTYVSPSVTFSYGAAMAFLAFAVLLFGQITRKL